MRNRNRNCPAKSPGLLRRLSRRICAARKRRTVERFVRGPEFAAYLLKPRPAKAPRKAKNPKKVRAEFVPLAALDEELMRMLGGQSAVLRLTERGADKMWRKHGAGMRTFYRRLSPHNRRHTEVPTAWYADIPKILREIEPYRNEKNRWQFDHVGLQRRLVVDLDDAGNPVLISYHPKRNLK